MACTILVVDDNRAHCYALGRTLTAEGFNVLHAHTGSETIALTVEHTPHLVLLDINLPDMNGYAVCRSLKQKPETRHLPVIFHSASDTTPANHEVAMQSGAAAFLTYPIEPKHLVNVIRGCVARAAETGS